METTDPNIAPCPSCGTLIDASEQELFALVNCSVCGAQMRVQTQFANFEIQGELGEGGQGRVFRALDKKLGRPVALKVMKREYSEDPEFVRRFESEARITASLSNPHVVKVYSFGEHRGLLYLVMELVEKGSLLTMMSRVKQMGEAHVLDIGTQVATGLKAGLELGLIHRDIKPGNILFSDPRTAKLVDFGLAILVEKQAEEQGDVWATPYYVSPEKLEGQPEDFRSDIYSLAATLFHAMAGRPPFLSESNSMSELRKIKSTPVQIQKFAPHVSAPTAYVIDKALSVKPEDRYSSYDELIKDLQYAHQAALKRPVQVRKRARKSEKRGGTVVTFLTVAVILGAGLYLWMNRDRYFGDPNANKPVVALPDPDAEERYALGRKQLAEGKFGEAARTFRALAVEGKLLEPKNAWASVHLGLAEFFADQPDAARATFKALPDRVAATAPGMDPKLLAFFDRLASLTSDNPKEGASDFASLDTTSYESVAFLVAGLKQWNTGQYEEGVALLRKFQQSQPEEDFAWVGEYRGLVGPYVEEFGKYEQVANAMKNFEAAPEAAEAALKKLPDVKTQLHSPVLIRRLDELEKESTPKIKEAVAAAKEAIMKKQAEQEAKDDEALTTAKLQLKELCENYRFAEGLTLIRGVDVKSDSKIVERDLLAKRVGWLIEFKQQLIADLNAAPCVAPVVRKNGQRVGVGAGRANDQQVEVRLQFGNSPMVWTDINAQSVLAMAKFYLKPTLPPSTLADREWRAAVFALFTGLFDDGQPLMDSAAAKKPEYQTDRALFFGPAEPAPAK